MRMPLPRPTPPFDRDDRTGRRGAQRRGHLVGGRRGTSVQCFPELTRAERKIDAPTGCNSAYVDVDTMAIGNAVGHEFYVSLCKDPANRRSALTELRGLNQRPEPQRRRFAPHSSPVPRPPGS